MSFTSNEQTKICNNIRKIKYSTTEIKYTRCEKRNCSKKNIENYALNFKRRTYQNVTFFLIRLFINENSLNG